MLWRLCCDWLLCGVTGHVLFCGCEKWHSWLVSQCYPTACLPHHHVRPSCLGFKATACCQHRFWQQACYERAVSPGAALPVNYIFAS